MGSSQGFRSNECKQWDECHFFSVKTTWSWGKCECVCVCIVMQQQLIAFVPQCLSLLLHIFSQAPLNVAVEVAGWNKFLASHALCVQQQKMLMSLLFLALWTCCTFFGLGDCRLIYCNNSCPQIIVVKPDFIVCCNPRDETKAVISHLIRLKASRCHGINFTTMHCMFMLSIRFS